MLIFKWTGDYLCSWYLNICGMSRLIENHGRLSLYLGVTQPHPLSVSSKSPCAPFPTNCISGMLLCLYFKAEYWKHNWNFFFEMSINMLLRRQGRVSAVPISSLRIISAVNTCWVHLVPDAIVSRNSVGAALFAVGNKASWELEQAEEI